MTSNNPDFEVIIIGGSYAGLSSAMALGRSLRKVLIIDSNLPCNRQTPHSHNFLTQDGHTPGEISTIARQQVEKYKTVKFHQGLAIKGAKTARGFEIVTEKNEKFIGQKLIFATGITDIIPEIKGFAECWGISVIHCPYCHGYEFRNQKTAILANGPKAYHLASLVHNLTDNLTILSPGEANFSPEQVEKLDKNRIRIIEKHISEFEHENGHLLSVVFDDHTRMSVDAVYASIPFAQHSDIPVSLGCLLSEHGYLQVDHLQKTTVPDIYACGDNSNMMRSVANAVYSGNLTGAVVNAELAGEQF